jgi:hypothetical protein
MDEETVERLEGKDKALELYKEQLDALKEDLEVVIAFSGPISLIWPARRLKRDRL